MKEQLDYSYDKDKDRVTLSVDMSTVFALVEYIAEKKVPLAFAVQDLLTIGMYVITNQSADFSIEEEYPHGENDYVAPEDMDENLLQAKSISINMLPMTREGLKLMSDDVGLDQDVTFALLIEEARKLRIKHKKGADLYLVNEAGSRMPIELS